MKALKYLSFVGKIAGLVSALNVIPFVDPMVGVIVFAAASILKDAVASPRFVANLVHAAGGHFNLGGFVRRIPFIEKEKCSKEDSNLHRLPY